MSYAPVKEPDSTAPFLAPASERQPLVRDYVADMAAELSSLALSVGEARAAELLARAAEAARTG